ncbi:MAG: sulfatase-like hydrolase/transferase [Verrucomicrobia bacterium]|nr:sulfatase-like hydrolase/transferase [Verrucomicrobiota bacterium]
MSDTRRRSRRFFLYLPYTLPHIAFQIPQLEPYTVNTNWTQQQRYYASMITYLDRDIGRILDLLQAQGIDENTLVFFCSDNGAADRYDSRFNSSGNLRGRKRDVYEGGIRTPMLVRWPGQVAAGVTSDAIWYFADVLPTLAELVGAPVPQGVDGVSVLPTLRSQSQPELADRPLYWEFHEEQFAQAIRRGRWKAVRQNPHLATELYDLQTDPGESNNVAAAHPEKVAEFERLFVTMRTPTPIWQQCWMMSLSMMTGACQRLMGVGCRWMTVRWNCVWITPGWVVMLSW